MFGLLGPNGAGKTTLVRILATLLRPTGGRATILGHDVVADSLAVRRRIGLAGQFAAVDEELTGRENVEMIGQLYRLSAAEARARASEILERFSLTDAADRRVATYSGGMRRRLDLCASLTGRPPVILLDEPTTGLDPRSRQELWDTVDGPAAGRHHGAADHAVPRGGRPARAADRGDRPRAHRGGGHGRRAQGDGGDGRSRRSGRRHGAHRRGGRRARGPRRRRRAARRPARRRDPPCGGRSERVGRGRSASRRPTAGDRRRRVAAAEPGRRVPHLDRSQRRGPGTDERHEQEAA